VHQFAEEDMGYMRDVVLMRMEEHFQKAKPLVKESSSSSSSSSIVDDAEDVASLKDQIKMLQVQVRNEKKLREEAEQRSKTAIDHADKLRQRGIVAAIFGWE
jgi:hypothetical protein